MSDLSSEVISGSVLALILARTTTQFWLERLNQRHVLARAEKVPDGLAGVVDPATYAKSIEYTFAKSRLRLWEMALDTTVLLALLFGGLLPKSLGFVAVYLGTSAWAMAAFLFSVGILVSVLGLPLEWYAQFRLEQHFGFNTSTQGIWWLDRLKGFLLAGILGYPLLVLILKLVEWTGIFWWLWGWAALLTFQLLMAVLAPVILLPLFNKFTPLPPGELRDRLLRLADRTHFRARSIQLMDGSKRSRHSNAFFIGFGRFRKIVLFDTLLEHLATTEVEAVLAHEIGHYKRRHIPRMLAASALGSLAGFFLLAMLARQPCFYTAFGFTPGNTGVALLLFALLSGVLTFWISPLVHWWSRRYEYQADQFAARTMGEPKSLISALRKLNEKNLSTLTPHPLYSGFYYSHPTLIEREQALLNFVKS